MFPCEIKANLDRAIEHLVKCKGSVGCDDIEANRQFGHSFRILRECIKPLKEHERAAKWYDKLKRRATQKKVLAPVSDEPVRGKWPFFFGYPVPVTGDKNDWPENSTFTGGDDGGLRVFVDNKGRIVPLGCIIEGDKCKRLHNV